MSRVLRMLRSFLRDEDAPTSVEYAIMVGLIAAVVVGAATVLGVNTDALLRTVLNALPGG